MMLSPEAMKKSDCNEANYEMLHNDAKGSMQGEDCVWQRPYGQDEYWEETAKDCDCSDPDSYSFYNEGRA